VPLALVAGCLAGSIGLRASAQGRDPDANLMALVWARGRYVSPMVCQVNGEPVRALRHVQIQPTPPSVPEKGMRVLFPDPEAAGATRCFSELGPDEPKIAGAVVLGRSGRSRPDTAQRDFQSALERDQGFDYGVRSGTLRLSGWTDGATVREVDFTKGTARLRRVRPGSDEARVLADLAGDRALSLELEAGDGTKLFFPLVQLPER
jgi:hypothetical protein